MLEKSFFLQQEEHSKIKSEIVTKYFCAWANVMIGHQSERLHKVEKRIAYVDLYSGPGRYEDGSPSTPLMILEKIVENEKYREWVATVFNDKDSNYCTMLEKEIQKINGINRLKYKPLILNKVVDDDLTIFFEKTELIPTLCFADPWGYKGLSLRLFSSILKNFGCDLLIFFNYNRINMSLFNKLFVKDMYALFGQDRVDELRLKLQKAKNPSERKQIVIDEFTSALKAICKHVHFFTFKKPDGKKISHQLVFASKSVLGYTIFKEITAPYSTRKPQGVPSFEFNPKDQAYAQLIDSSRPLDELCGILLEDFAGQNLKMKEVFDTHHVGKDYIEKNYKDALLKLEEKEKIETDPPASKRPKRKGKLTFGPDVNVFFPLKIG